MTFLAGADPGEEHERAVVDGGGPLEAAAPRLLEGAGDAGMRFNSTRILTKILTNLPSKIYNKTRFRPN